MRMSQLVDTLLERIVEVTEQKTEEIHRLKSLLDDREDDIREVQAKLKASREDGAQLVRQLAEVKRAAETSASPRLTQNQVLEVIRFFQQQPAVLSTSKVEAIKRVRVLLPHLGIAEAKGVSDLLCTPPPVSVVSGT